MNIQRIIGILRQEFYITTRSIETINDVFVFQFIQLILFGVFALFLIATKASLAAHYLIMGTILWQILSIIQYSISMGCLWNIWARNLSNMFIAPLSPAEYLAGFTASGIVKALLVFTISSTLAKFVFGFSIWDIGFFNILLCFINLAFFAFSLGILIMGFIFRFGTRIQAFAWSVIPLLQPITAAFYPLHVLPYPVQLFAWLFPSTFVFEAARANLLNPSPQWQLQGIAFAENVLYVIMCNWIFQALFRASKQSGQFARNEA